MQKNILEKAFHFNYKLTCCWSRYPFQADIIKVGIVILQKKLKWIVYENGNYFIAEEMEQYFCIKMSYN